MPGTGAGGKMAEERIIPSHKGHNKGNDSRGPGDHFKDLADSLLNEGIFISEFHQPRFPERVRIAFVKESESS